MKLFYFDIGLSKKVIAITINILAMYYYWPTVFPKNNKMVPHEADKIRFSVLIAKSELTFRLYRIQKMGEKM